MKRRFQAEYGSDAEAFLNQIYEPGLDTNDEAANIWWEGEKTIDSANKFLRLIDGSVEPMRRYYPQGAAFAPPAATSSSVLTMQFFASSTDSCYGSDVLAVDLGFFGCCCAPLAFSGRISEGI